MNTVIYHYPEKPTPAEIVCILTGKTVEQLAEAIVRNENGLMDRLREKEAALVR